MAARRPLRCFRVGILVALAVIAALVAWRFSEEEPGPGIEQDPEDGEAFWAPARREMSPLAEGRSTSHPSDSGASLEPREPLREDGVRFLGAGAPGSPSPKASQATRGVQSTAGRVPATGLDGPTTTGSSTAWRGPTALGWTILGRRLVRDSGVPCVEGHIVLVRCLDGWIGFHDPDVGSGATVCLQDIEDLRDGTRILPLGPDGAFVYQGHGVGLYFVGTPTEYQLTQYLGAPPILVSHYEEGMLLLLEDGQEREVVLWCEQRGTLEGWVLDWRGRPFPRDPGLPQRVFGVHALVEGGEVRRAAYETEDVEGVPVRTGRFFIRGVPRNRRVHVVAKVLGFAERWVEGVVIRDESAVVEVRMPPPDGPGIRGMLRSLHGTTPVVGLRVKVDGPPFPSRFHWDGAVAETLVGQDGHFEITGLAQATYPRLTVVTSAEELVAEARLVRAAVPPTHLTIEVP